MKKYRFLTAVIFAVFVLAGNACAAEKSFVVENLRDKENGADYLVIAHASFIDTLKPLLEKRAADGLRVAVVTPQDIYKEFPRISEGPKAINGFIRYAANNWKAPAPKYLLLVGDINVYQEFRPEGKSLPTFILRMDGELTPSDNPYGDINFDELPEIAVGRIPTNDPDRLALVVRKTLALETNPPSGPWRRRISAFASTGNFGPFDATLEEITRRIIRANFDPMYDMNMTYGGSALPYFLLPAEFRKQIIERFNEGALFLTYIGHGGVTGLSTVCWNNECKPILDMPDITGIDAKGKNPFFFSICCSTGRFAFQESSIAEELLFLPGGPIGTFAASKTSMPYPNALLSKEIIYSVIRNHPATIGEALINIKRGLIEHIDAERKFIDGQYRLMAGKAQMLQENLDAVYMYNYFGDPAARIPYPAQNLAVTAPASAAPGAAVSVSVSSPDRKPARLLLTIEAFPTEVIHPIKPFDTLKGDRLTRAVRANYEGANDKAAARIETKLSPDGTAHATMKLPANLPPGDYYVKAYAWDGVPDTMGTTKLEITGKNPPIAPRTLTSTVKSRADRKSADPLLDAIQTVKEPDTRGMSKFEENTRFRPYFSTDTPSVAEMERALADKPGDLDTLRRLALAALREADADTLTETLDKIQSDPAGRPVLLDVSDQIIGDTPFNETAVKYLEKIAPADPKDPMPYAFIGRAYKFLNRDQEAVAALKKSIGVKPTKDAYVDLWQIYADQGKYDEAEKAVLEAEKIAKPGDGIAQMAIYYFINNGKYDLAMKRGRRLFADQREPGREYLYRELASMLYRKDPTDLRESFRLLWTYYKLSNAKYPKAMAVAELANMKYYSGCSRDTRKEDAQRALDISPQCAECLVVACYDPTIPYLTAIDTFQRAIDMDPKLAKAYRCKADAQFKHGNYYAAVENYNKARGLEPDAPVTVDEISALYANDWKEKALSLLEKPEKIDTYYGHTPASRADAVRIVMYIAANKKDLAMERFRNFAEQYPWEVVAMNAIAWKAREAQNYDLAVEALQAASRYEPQNTYVLTDLGDYALKTNNNQDAVDALLKANALRPKDGRILSMLSQAYSRMNSPQQTRKYGLEAIQYKWSYDAVSVLNGMIDVRFYME